MHGSNRTVFASISYEEKSFVRLAIGCCLDWMREQETLMGETTASSQQKYTKGTPIYLFDSEEPKRKFLIDSLIMWLNIFILIIAIGLFIEYKIANKLCEVLTGKHIGKGVVKPQSLIEIKAL